MNPLLNKVIKQALIQFWTLQKIPKDKDNFYNAQKDLIPSFLNSEQLTWDILVTNQPTKPKY